jgi:hypothetical protein
LGVPQNRQRGTEYGLGRPLLGRLQSQKKASAGTEAVQRKKNTAIP